MSLKEDFEKYTVARTNKAGVEFLTETFPTKKVKGLNSINRMMTQEKMPCTWTVVFSR